MNNKYNQARLRHKAIREDCDYLTAKLEEVEQSLSHAVVHLDQLGYPYPTLVRLLNRVIEVRDLSKIVQDELDVELKQ